MPHLSMLFQPTYLVSCEADGFEWAPEQESILKQVQAEVQVALPLEPYDPVDPIIPQISVTDRMSYETSGNPQKEIVHGNFRAQSWGKKPICSSTGEWINKL